MDDASREQGENYGMEGQGTRGRQREEGVVKYLQQERRADKMTAALGQQKGRSEELWHGPGRSRGGHDSTPDVVASALARFL